MVVTTYDDRERAALYRLFADLFIRYPSPDTADRLRDMFKISSDETPDEIVMDFSRIFSGKWRHLLPYESIYATSFGERPGLMGKAAENVQAFYRATGLVIPGEANLFPDHLFAELLFMSYLAENSLVEHQKTFLERHLYRWVPLYCDEVSDHASTSFYKELAQRLKEFIVFEAEQFGVQGHPDELFPGNRWGGERG